MGVTISTSLQEMQVPQLSTHRCKRRTSPVMCRPCLTMPPVNLASRANLRQVALRWTGVQAGPRLSVH